MPPLSPRKRRKGSAQSRKVSPESESSRTSSEQSSSYSDTSDSAISEDVVAVGPTPKNEESTVATEVKLRAIKAAPDGQRCLLTLEDRPAIQACHLISVSKTKRKMLRRLEYFWGLRPGQLNLHSRWNLLYLRSDLHLSFDQGDWALLPSESVLEQIRESLFQNLRERTQPPKYTTEFPKETWDYTFRPLHKYPWTSIFRRILPEEDDDKKYASFHDRKDAMPEHEIFLPPFDTFPVLKSHVHPFFASYNAGEKLAGCGFLPKEYQKTRRMVEEIFFRWTNASIPKSPKRARHAQAPTSRGASGATGSTRTCSSTKRQRDEDRSNPESPEAGSALKKSKQDGTKRGRGRTDLPCPSSASTPELDKTSSGSDSVHEKLSSHTQAELEDVQESGDPLSPPLPFWENIPNWVVQNTKAAAKGDLTSSLGNYSRDIKEYQREKARKPPPETSWVNWNVEWAKARGVVDPRIYGPGWSSNDWARWRKDTLLPRSID